MVGEYLVQSSGFAQCRVIPNLEVINPFVLIPDFWARIAMATQRLPVAGQLEMPDTDLIRRFQKRAGFSIFDV
jgi:hypothetical protein